MRDGAVLVFPAESLEHLAPREPAAVDQAVGRLQGGDVIGGMAAAAEPHHVQADDAARLSVDEHVRGHILHHAGMAADHREPADAAELVHGHRTRDEGPVFDGHMAAEERSVGENTVVAHRGIVAEMGAGHHVVVAADRRARIRLESPVDGDVLAKPVVIADADAADVPRSSRVLRCATHDRVLAKLIVAAGHHPRLDHRAGGDGTEVAKFDVILDRSERPDLHPDAESSIRTHDGHRVDAHGGPFAAGNATPTAGLSARDAAGFNASFRSRGKVSPARPVGRPHPPPSSPPSAGGLYSGSSAAMQDLRLEEVVRMSTRDERYAEAERLKDSGDLAGAVAALEQLVADDADFPFSYTALSVACMRAGMIPEAEDALARSRMLQG